MGFERWFRIELRHLFALEAVAEEGSFSAASDRLGYVQSAVSHQIATLEGVVGKRLFERSRGSRPVLLTDDGAILYGHAKTILARVRAAEMDLSIDQSARLLRIGSFQMVSAKIVPRVVKRLAGDVEICLFEQMTEVGLLEQLADGDLDAVFSEGPLPDGPFEAVPLFSDPYVLLAAATSPVAQRGVPLSLNEIASLPLIGHSRMRPRLAGHLAARQLVANYVVRSDVNATIQGLVREGVGYAIVPRFSFDTADESVVALPLDPPDAIQPRELLLVWNSDRSSDTPIEAFVEATREVCMDLELASPYEDDVSTAYS